MNRWVTLVQRIFCEKIFLLPGEEACRYQFGKALETTQSARIHAGILVSKKVSKIVTKILQMAVEKHTG